MRPVREEPVAGEVPLWRNREWSERFPWLQQGTTGRGEAEHAFDLGLGGSQPVGQALKRWRALQAALEMPSAVHALQVHAADLRLHRAAPDPGLLVMAGVDGHLTAAPGLLLTVSVADCVPLFLVHPERRAVALLHAGWRGVAAGILEAGLRRMAEAFGSPASALWLHLGPAICGECYEVGPEVHATLRPSAVVPRAPAPVDLRALLLERAAAAGMDPERCSASAHCTRCTAGEQRIRELERPFFSHRAGEAGRQMGVIGIRP